jgi:hypothetical protein
MPKRSNEFQRLVYLVKTHVAAGIAVTESKLLRDRITGTEREVDICIESTISGHRVTISIECRDHKRPADVGWVEKMKAKHERLPTNALVLSSRSGFTREAAEVARISGIELLPFHDNTDQALDHLVGATGSLWAKTFALTPRKVVIGVEPAGDLPAEDVNCMPDNYIYDHNGEQLATVKELVELLLHAEPVIKNFGETGGEVHKWFEVRWETPRDRDGNALCLRKLEPSLLRPMMYVRVTGECTFEIAEFRLREGTLGGVRVAWATGTFLGDNALLVASQDESGEKKLSISPASVKVSKEPAP